MIADKCGIMHMKTKGVKRSEQKFVMNGKAVQNLCGRASI